MKDLNRKQKETLIYRHKHNDYKGRTKDGQKLIMPPFGFNNGTCLIVLSSLTDSELDRLWDLERHVVLHREEKRKGMK